MKAEYFMRGFLAGVAFASILFWFILYIGMPHGAHLRSGF